MRVSGGDVDIGPDTCIEQDSLDTIPPSGKVFFYVVQDSSYGSESVGRARVVGRGGSSCR